VLVFNLILSSCRVHGRERPVWSCGVVDWFGRPLYEQPVAWFRVTVVSGSGFVSGVRIDNEAGPGHLMLGHLEEGR